MAGNRQSHHVLYKKYASVMMGICMRYSRTSAEAEDILQDGFIKVFSYLKNYRHEGSFEGWIKRIMINTAINHYHQNLKFALHTDIDNIDEQQLIPVETDSSNETTYTLTQEEFMILIQELPDGYRVVFNLFAIEGYGHKEIADMLNISESTSKSQLFKAKKLLKNKICSRMNKLYKSSAR
ncbi:MAG: RNA polymerase sigma factor [Bacteroidetes bacterium]|nr:RNA polymerase sigma factor [Bacteroidota bacterium]